MPQWSIINADARDGMKALADGSIHCAVTSPPYWALRNYNAEGQIGMEPTIDAWVSTLVGVFAEVHRVLRDDGTFWVNCGDSYSNCTSGGSSVFENGRTDGKSGDGGKLRLEEAREANGATDYKNTKF